MLSREIGGWKSLLALLPLCPEEWSSQILPHILNLSKMRGKARNFSERGQAYQRVVPAHTL